MKKVSRIFNILSTLSCIIAIILLYTFNIIVNGIYFNGYIILIFLCMLLNPIANLCRLNKKVIINPIYHIIIITITTWITYTSLNSLLIYKKYLTSRDNSLALNTSVNYFGEVFIYIVCAVFLTLILGLIFKKVKIKSNKDNSKLMFIILLITSVLPFFANKSMGMLWTLVELIFLVVTFIKTRGINTSSELQKYYLILIILSLLSCNPISLVLSTYMFLQLDVFGLNI